MENGGNKIEIKVYTCGSCKNNLAHVFKGYGKEIRFFPAMVVLIKHKDFGNILYDTGYSPLIYKNHFVSFLYNTLNKSYVTEDDTIVSKLQADGMNPDSIKKVILSHAHPDHIGGLKLLSDYELISTKKVLDTLKNGNVFQLVFRNMKPENNVRYQSVQEWKGDSFLAKYFPKVYDVLGDGSVLGVELNGHADGQLGIYLPEHQIFFAADVCWGTDLMCRVKDMRFVAKMIQNNYKEYVETIDRIQRFMEEHAEVKVMFTHDVRKGESS